MSEEAAERAERAVEATKKIFLLTLSFTVVAIFILLVDHQIKRDIVDQAQQARQMLAAVTEVAGGVYGAAKANPAGSDTFARLGGSDDVVSDSRNGQALPEDADAPKTASARRKASAERGVSGHGR